VNFGVIETGNYTASACVVKSAAGITVSVGSFVSAHYLSLPMSVCTKFSSTRTGLLAPGTKG
jgi:hypothetical protein